MEEIESGSEVLKWVGNTASWQRAKADSITKWQPVLVLQTCGGVGDTAYEPPQSITVTGVDSLKALRKAIDEALKYEI